MYVSRCPGCGVETVLTGYGRCQNCQSRSVIARTAVVQMAHQRALASRVRSEQEEFEQTRQSEEGQRFVCQALHEIASQEVSNPERAAARLAVFLATEEYHRHPDLAESTIHRLGLSSEYEAALVVYLSRARVDDVRTVLDRVIEQDAGLYERVMADPQFCGRDDYEHFSRHREEHEIEQQRRAEQLEEVLTDAENERRVTEFHRKTKPFVAFGAWLVVWGTLSVLALWFDIQDRPDPEIEIKERLTPVFLLVPVAVLITVPLRRVFHWLWRLLVTLGFAIKLTREQRTSRGGKSFLP